MYSLPNIRRNLVRSKLTDVLIQYDDEMPQGEWGICRLSTV